MMMMPTMIIGESNAVDGCWSLKGRGGVDGDDDVLRQREKRKMVV